VPPELRPLLGDASAVVRSLDLASQARLGPAGFTSLYVDRFAPGGRFVPHADRDIYGPLVATLSLGAPATVRFTCPDDIIPTDEPDTGSNDRSGDGGPLPVDLRLASGDLYAFWPPMRHAPWVHEVLPVAEPRISVSLRTAASAADH
jgi:alkylated DNA repair dioxygenase AlkB